MPSKRKVPYPPPKPKFPAPQRVREVERAYIQKHRLPKMRAARAVSAAAAQRHIKAELHSFERKDVLTKSYPPGNHVIICEGDSWFNHPLIHDIPDQLKYFGYSVLHSNYPGKLLQSSLDDGFFLAPLKDNRKPQIKALLVSGGGNDLINWRKENADFSPIFRKAAPNHPAEDYIDADKVKTALGEMTKCLRGIAKKLRDADAAKLPVLLHAYEFIQPKKFGPRPFKGSWIDGQLDAVGAPRDAQFRKKITTLLQNPWIQAYKDVCKDLGWHFIVTQNLVKGRWHDEIHPTDFAFYDVASVFWYALHSLGILPSKN